MTEYKLMTIAGTECYKVPDIDLQPGQNCGLCLFNDNPRECHAEENQCIAEKVHFIEPTAEALEAHKVQVIAMRLKS